MANKKVPITKTDFIMSFAADTPAKDIVAAGKKKGLKLSDRYVYVVRSAKRTKAKSRNGSNGKTPQSDLALRQAIADIGLSRARAVLLEVEKAFGG